MPSSPNSASGNSAMRALRILKALAAAPSQAYAMMREPGALSACALAYCAALPVSALFSGQMSQAQGFMAQPTSYIFRLGVEAGWGTVINAVWFAFLTLLATSAPLHPAIVLGVCVALPASLAALAFVAGPGLASGTACGLAAGWLLLSPRAKRFELKAPLCLLLAVLALSPLAEAAGALASPSDAAVIAVQILFGFWILYLTARGLKNIYATSAPKALLLTILPMLGMYVALFSLYKAGLMSQAAMEVLSGF